MGKQQATCYSRTFPVSLLKLLSLNEKDPELKPLHLHLHLHLF